MIVPRAPARAGWSWLRRRNTRVGHRIEVGPHDMQFLTIGDLVPGVVCVYRESQTFTPARDVELLC